jgi:hypothetical protein
MIFNNTRLFAQCAYEKMYNTIFNATDEERETLRQQLEKRLLSGKDSVYIKMRKIFDDYDHNCKHITISSSVNQEISRVYYLYIHNKEYTE